MLRQATLVQVRSTIQHHLSGLGCISDTHTRNTLTHTYKHGFTTTRRHLAAYILSVSKLIMTPPTPRFNYCRSNGAHEHVLMSRYTYRSRTTRSVAVSALLLRMRSRFWIFCSSSDGSHLPFRMEAVRPRIRGLHGQPSHS